MNQITLKRKIYSRTFELTFPKGEPIEYEIMGGRLYAKHPEEIHSYKVSLDNVDKVINPAMYKSPDFTAQMDKDHIVYIPEPAINSSDIYTLGDFLKLTRGDFNKAFDLWSRCEREMPETLLDL